MVFSVITRPDSGAFGARESSGKSTAGSAALAPGAAAARKSMFQLTEGRSKDLANDPYQKSAMDFLRGQVSGQNMPYTNTVKNSILAQQGKGFADAEAAQMQSLRDSLGASGGSIYDPGYQASQRQAMSQRQGANLDAQGQLNAKADLENFQAKSQGASQLSAARAAQNAQVNQMNLAAADLHSRTQVPTAPAAPGAPQAPGGMTPWEIQQQVNAQNNAVFNRL